MSSAPWRPAQTPRAPIVATLADALRLPSRPTTLLLGTAPVGGRLAGSWRDTILQALNAGLDIANGLHEFIGDDPEFAAAARRSGARIYDFRRPPERMEVATGREHLPGKRVILTVGTDCAVGKMSVALELARAAREAGLSAAMVPTGQTGMMIEGWGITIDRVAADFLQGTVEWLTEEGERRADWLVIEGQGSLDHIAYSSCTLGLLHGSRPHGMVLVHQPGRDRHVLFENAGAHATLRPLAQHIAAHESVAALVEPAPVVAVALNTSLHDEAQARRLIERTAAETGLPVDDPYRFGPTRLFDAIRSRLDAGPDDDGDRLRRERPRRRRRLTGRTMGFEVTWDSLELSFRDPFRIARNMDAAAAHTVITHLSDDDDRDEGREGIGEAFAEPYYGETTDTVPVVLPYLLAAVEPLSFELRGDRPTALRALERASDAMAAALGHHGGAKAGIDIALHDLVGKRLGVPVHELLGLSTDLPPTDFTIGIDEPEVVAQRAARAAKFPALKIKLGGPKDLATLEAVRAVFSGPIRVDANTGWEPEAGARLIPELVRLGVELVEQPFPAHRLDQMRWLQERSSLPIVADESAVDAEDLEGLVGVCQGVNVKLAKCGGIGPAHRMLLRARELGFKTFLGCMEETTVGIAASAVVASLADWVDLDGNLLLEEDPYEGLTLDPVVPLASCPREPGLGVRERA